MKRLTPLLSVARTYWQLVFVCFILFSETALLRTSQHYATAIQDITARTKPTYD
nr:MAG TPA: hypothetical protein [Caudoviricetes sp.]